MIKVTKEQQQAFNALAKQYGFRLLYIFGSHARGDNAHKSDLDIAYASTTGKSLKLEERFTCEDAIKNILGIQTEVVDMINVHMAPPVLLYSIANDGVLLYGTKANDEHFFISAMKQYIDARPLLQATKNYVDEKIAQF